MPFRKTYEIITSPDPISWDDYTNKLMNEWELLLNNEEKQKSEKAYQRFLEDNFCLLPGAFGLIGRSGHYPYPGAVVAQPQLNGLFKRIPDFMWIANDSGTLYPVFIEIEAPYKQWFLDNGKQTDEFTQAHNQLAEWKQWFAKPTHVSLFLEYFQIPSDFLWGKSIRPLFLLIYGRRSEFDRKPFLSEKRRYMAREDEFLMTYDSLSPDYGVRNLMCVRIKDNSYKAISVSPTYTLGPSLAGWHALISGRKEAIEHNLYISKERKDFLISRIPYWENWAKKGEKGVINTGDKE